MRCLNAKSYEWHDVTNGTVDTIFTMAGKAGCYTDEIYPSCCDTTYKVTKPFIDKMINYFETENYIFTHGWIPKRKDWRASTFAEWEEARWLCGIDQARGGHIADKAVVCGHWHASYGHHLFSGTPEFGAKAVFDPFYSKGIIALDACTAASGKVNVVRLEDDFLDASPMLTQHQTCV